MNAVPLPRIRFVEAHPLPQSDPPMFVLADPAGYAAGPITATPEALYLMQHLDGVTTVETVQHEFLQAFGQEVKAEQIRKLVGWLDANFFLDTETFARRKQEVDAEFLDAPVRPYQCFGDDNPVTNARALLDEAYREAGYPQGCAIRPDGPPIAGIVAPHIDYQRGGAVYGHAYGMFFSRFAGDTVVILGTNHQPAEMPIVMTDKDFETPFGLVRTDAALVSALAESVEGDVFADQIAHRREHSIELAAAQIAYADRHRDVKIVPVLVTGFAEFFLSGQNPCDHPQVASFLAALQNLVADRGTSVALIASADLAHVGRQFGDPDLLDDDHMKDLERKDRESLAFVEKGEAAGFAGYVAAEKDARRICGLGPIWLALSALAPIRGELLAYGQWLDPEGFGAVSFAAQELSRPD